MKGMCSWLRRIGLEGFGVLDPKTPWATGGRGREGGLQVRLGRAPGSCFCFGEGSGV